MKREELKAKGFSDEQIEYLMAENGKDINAAKAAADVANEALKQAQEKSAGLEQQIAARDRDIQTLRDEVKGNTDLTQKLTDLQTKYDHDTKDLQKRLEDQRTDFAVERAFAEIPFASQLAKRAAIADFRSKGYKPTDKGTFAEAEAYIANLKKEDPAAFKPESNGDNGNQNNPNAGDNPQGGHAFANGNAYLGSGQLPQNANLPRFTSQMTNHGQPGGPGNGAAPMGLALNFVRKPPEMGK